MHSRHFATFGLCLLGACIVAMPVMAEDNTVKEEAKEVGRATGAAAREVGQGAKEVTKEVGKTVADAARETGHAFRDGAKEFRKAVKSETAKKK